MWTVAGGHIEMYKNRELATSRLDGMNIINLFLGASCFDSRILGRA
jgi:hypothetical protein